MANEFKIKNGAISPLVILQGTTSNSVTLQPSSTAGTVTYTLPTVDGSSGQVLSTNGSGTLSWATGGSGSVTITDDTSTNATRYLIFDDSTSGTQSTFNVSSTKLTFNPSTGILSSTGFSGPVNGTVGAIAPNTGSFITLTITGANDLRLADSDSSNYVGFKSPATVSTNVVWTLPSSDGTSNQVLSTNGSGTLSWATAASSPSSSIVAGENLVSGDLVNVYSDSGVFKVREANASLQREAHGYVTANVTSGNTATVYFSGISGGYTGLTPGIVYLSAATAGLPTNQAAQQGGHIVQKVGVAISATQIMFVMGEPITLA